MSVCEKSGFFFHTVADIFFAAGARQANSDAVAAKDVASGTLLDCDAGPGADGGRHGAEPRTDRRPGGGRRAHPAGLDALLLGRHQANLRIHCQFILGAKGMCFRQLNVKLDANLST